MKKTYRIKKNSEYQLVFKNGKSTANRQFVIYILNKPAQPNFRIGLSVSKQIGNAVVRNKVKRLIRETFQSLIEDLPNHYDFVIIARKPTSSMNFHEVKSSIIHILKLAKILPRTYGHIKKHNKGNVVRKFNNRERT